MRLFRLIAWTAAAIAALAIVLVLQYTLPKTRVVIVTDTSNRMMALGMNAPFYASSGATRGGREARDVRFIDTVDPNGRVFVLRNEDTGVFWPPYLKFDSSDLHATAGKLRSTVDSPRWVSITYYGWRFPWFTIFPNAVSITPVDGPDTAVRPWGLFVFPAVLAAFGLLACCTLARVRRRALGLLGGLSRRDAVSKVPGATPASGLVGTGLGANAVPSAEDVFLTSSTRVGSTRRG